MPEGRPAGGLWPPEAKEVQTSCGFHMSALLDGLGTLLVQPCKVGQVWQLRPRQTVGRPRKMTTCLQASRAPLPCALVSPSPPPPKSEVLSSATWFSGVQPSPGPRQPWDTL